MFLIRPKYGNLYIVILAMLVAIPCSLKKELKQYLNVDLESSQPSNSNNTKTSCKTVCLSQQTSQQEKKKKEFLPGNPKTFSAAICNLEIKASLIDLFSVQKEKIPTYILHESFLI